MYYDTSQLSQNYAPMFEHGFLPLINNHSFGHPLPTDNDRAYDHRAMLAFPQEKISHYNTGATYYIFR